jgi:hypothetical protein
MKSLAAAIALAISLPLGIGFAADDRRKYDDGPLTIADFKAPTQDGTRGAAFTSTQLSYEMRYRYKSAGDNVTVTLESITIDAHIRRDQSWNKEPENKRLLDHEQGHADIAQIHCLKARLAFRDKLAKKKGITATAGSLQDAAAALDREVRKEMSAFENAAREADSEYDRETMNGLGGTQAEWRRVQSETLKELAEKWGKRK